MACLVWHVDMCIPCRSCHGMQIFQRISDAVHHIIRQKGFKFINYVDDSIGIGVPNIAQRYFDALCQLMCDLGLDVSQKKLVALGTVVICLGVEINTGTSTISIPAHKLDQIEIMVKECSVLGVNSSFYLVTCYTCTNVSNPPAYLSTGC